MSAEVHIVDLGAFLPNAPVGNDDMERLLGMVGSRPSRARRITLRNNGITSRHYAIDPVTLAPTHTNAALTAEAIRRGLARAGWRIGDIDLLACGTSSPDQLKPAHANMVHGELGEAPLEVISTAGVCSAGMAALKHAFLDVAAGGADRAVATGSELASSFMLARNFELEDEGIERVRPELAFEKDFLRWMLSDGAGCTLLARQPNRDRPTLRIDWIDGRSMAHRSPVCMYSGAVRSAEGGLRGWREAGDPAELAREHYFAVKQDARLLTEYLPQLVAPEVFQRLEARHGLKPGAVDWFLPHYSSNFFRERLRGALAHAGFEIPQERWFSNLATVGNIGAASMFVMLEELFYSGRLARGERILCMVPESARFAVYYMQLTVV